MKTFFLTLLILFTTLNLNAQLQVPTLTSPVMDLTNTLTDAEKAQLDQEIRSLYNNGQGPQITILIINSLQGESVEQAAHKIFTTWKLGDAKRDDGVLFLMALADRKNRIEVGQGLEGSLTDLASKRILDSLKPHFRAGQFFTGIHKGLNKIIQITKAPDAVQLPAQAPTPTAVTKTSEIQESSTDFLPVILFSALLFLTLLIGGRLLRNTFLAVTRYREEQKNSIQLSLKKTEIENKFGKSLALIQKNNISSLKKDEDMLSKAQLELTKEKSKTWDSDLAQKQRLDHELNDVKAQLHSLVSNINKYKEIIKKGK